MLLRICTFVLGLFMVMEVFCNVLDFYPVNMMDTLYKFSTIPIADWASLYFTNFFKVAYPGAFIGTITLFFFTVRLVFKGLGAAVEYEMTHGAFQWLTQDGEVVGHGDDGLENALITMVARFIVFILILPIMFLLMPLIIICDILTLGACVYEGFDEGWI